MADPKIWPHVELANIDSVNSDHKSRKMKREVSSASRGVFMCSLNWYFLEFQEIFLEINYDLSILQ